MKFKRFMAVMAFLCCFLTCIAQDVIIKKDGSRLEGKVVRITDTEVEYRKVNNSDGPVYAIKVSDLFRIDFENGDSEVFVKDDLRSEVPAAVFPGRTGDLKDTELYSKYKDFQDRYKTPKRLRRIGVWGGCSFVALGLMSMGAASFNFDRNYNLMCTGLILTAGGVVWGGTFYVLAYLKQKKNDNMYEIASIPLFRQSIVTSKEGRSFSIGVDYLADHDRTSTLGLGFTYLF